MTLYLSEKFSELITYATDGSLIRFKGGQFTATNKAQRDALDNVPNVRKAVKDVPKAVKKDVVKEDVKEVEVKDVPKTPKATKTRKK